MKLKKSSLCLVALTSCLLSSNAQAQVAIPNGIHINPELIERGKGLAKGLSKKFGKKSAIEAGKKVAQLAIVPMLLHPKKNISAAAVLGAGAGAGFWWYSTTMPATVKRMAKNPEDFELYWDDLAGDFDKKLSFAQTTWDLYYETTGEEQKKYENLIVLLGYERPNLTDFITPVSINPKTKVEQDDLENTKEFEVSMTEVGSLAAQMDLKYEPLCRGQVGQQIREQLVKLTPKDFQQLPLIKNNTGTVKFLNVDSYGDLKSKQYYLENDHIPSYAALEKNFLVSAFNKKGKKIRLENLEINASAISLPYKMHLNNRTWGKGNAKISELDQYDLRIATFLDFATLLAMKKLDKGNWETNKIDYNELLSAFSYVYGRNAQLCLYY